MKIIAEKHPNFRQLVKMPIFNSVFLKLFRHLKFGIAFNKEKDLFGMRCKLMYIDVKVGYL